MPLPPLMKSIELRNNGIIQPILVLGFVAKEQVCGCESPIISCRLFLHTVWPRDFDAVASSMLTVADVSYQTWYRCESRNRF
ncbi:MAG: hypothetical protein ACLR1V_10245 [Coprococcus sp.]